MADGDAVPPELLKQLQDAAPRGTEISPEAAQAIAQSMGGNAALIAALQGGLNKMVGASSGFIESLPPKMRARIAYLESLQDKHDELEEKFDEEMEALEKKYQALYAPLQAERAEIVKGEKEAPAPDEGDEKPSEAAEEASGKEGEGAEEVPAGIPEFWLNVLRNYEEIGNRITEKDEAVLEHLVDITCDELEGDGEAGFRLTFHFRENPFFTNTTLVKTYHMSEDEDNVLERAEGTEINWTSTAKNPTVKVMKKKPKKGAKPGTKPATKLEPVDSFFGFFSPPEVPPPGTELDEEAVEDLQQHMEDDYEIGDTIREKLIPHAVHWYTGEAIEQDMSFSDDEDDDDENDDEDDDDDDEDEDDDDDDEDDDAEGKPVTDSGEKPPECKQQ
mmetsp:Transcript_10203/g.30717  ORF Transcript_10203/g.30717 Transcript_10203/m.30717 type:complete len:389 (-) Transcript_10203:677-1843(-)